MFVVTYHTFGGSREDSMTPGYAWGFQTKDEAEGFVATFHHSCLRLNPNYEEESFFLLLVTEVPNVTAGAPHSSHTALFEAWREAKWPEWLDTNL